VLNIIKKLAIAQEIKGSNFINFLPETIRRELKHFYLGITQKVMINTTKVQKKIT